MRHSHGVTLVPMRILVPAIALVAAMAIAAGSATAARPDAPGRPGEPTRPSPPNRPDRPTPAPATPANPIAPTPARPGTPGAPATPGTPATPANPITGAPATGPSGTSTAGALPPVPRGARTAGLMAGRGDVTVRYFADLGHVASASGHMAVIPELLARLSSDALGTLVLRPLVVTGDPNSAEAACALLAAAGPNRAWHVAHHLAAARVTRDGDWVNPPVLRAVARKVPGLAPAAFTRAATSRGCFPRLNRFRLEARAAGVASSPTYVVTGDGGTVRLAAPASVRQVVDAIRGVG